MIQNQSVLDVADNSGAKKVTLKLLVVIVDASVGDIIVVSIESIPTGKMRKGQVARAVVVRTSKEMKTRGFIFALIQIKLFWLIPKGTNRNSSLARHAN